MIRSWQITWATATIVWALGVHGDKPVLSVGGIFLMLISGAEMFLSKESK